MPKLNQKGSPREAGIAQVLVLVLLLGGVLAGTYLVQQRTNLLPKASNLISLPVSGPITPTPKPKPDSDSDGWIDSQEAFIGTDPLDSCSDDKKDDAWPPDVDNNGKVNSADFNKINNKIVNKKKENKKKEYDKRLDLNTDSLLDVKDLEIVKKYLNKSCQDSQKSCQKDSDCKSGYFCKIVPLGRPCKDKDDCPTSAGVCIPKICPTPPACSENLIYGNPYPGDSNQCPRYVCTSPKPIPSGTVCAQVITKACSAAEIYPPICKDFPTPCDVPDNWVIQNSPTPTSYSYPTPGTPSYGTPSYPTPVTYGTPTYTTPSYSYPTPAGVN